MTNEQTGSEGDQDQATLDSDTDQVKLEQTMIRAFCRVLWTLTLALCFYLGFTVLGMIEGNNISPSGDGLGHMVALVLAIFAVLMTGIFVFMTFRIDRGARMEAATVAAEAATAIAVTQAERTAKAVAEQTARETAGAAAESPARDTAQEVAAAKATEVAVTTAKEQARLTATEVAERMLENMQGRIAEGVAEGVRKATGQ